MFYGHPVERLCTYQYSLVTLIPCLLQTLEDCGSPPLASRAPTLSRPTSLRTSDRKSLLAFVGLPLDVFGKVCFPDTSFLCAHYCEYRMPSFNPIFPYNKWTSPRTHPPGFVDAQTPSYIPKVILICWSTYVFICSFHSLIDRECLIARNKYL
jgi:Transport protein Avl9